MQYQAYLFDLDGVLVSTDEYHYRAWKAIADAEGIPFDRSINNRLRGVSRLASLDILLERASRPYSEAEKLALAEKKNAIYRESLKKLTPDDMLPGVRRVLQALKDAGKKIAIGSSSKNTKFILHQLGIAQLFDAIADGTEITHSKPDPEIFLLAVKKLQATPADCLVIEDAKAGVQAGHAAGMEVAGIGEAGEIADYPIRQLTDILSMEDGSRVNLSA